MRFYCYKCNNFYTAEVEDLECPYCEAVGDDIEECDDLNEYIAEEEEDFDFDAYDEYMRNEGEVLDALKLNRVR